MISDRDIYTAANILVKRYGEGAENDLDGQREWIRIVEAIKQLQRTRAPGEVVN